MRRGAIGPCLAFQHVGLRHVHAAVLARQHGAGLQGGLLVCGLWVVGGRLLGLFFFFLFEGIQAIFAPQPNAKQNSH